ncbi:hypothetical protein LAZ67_5004363 [Cordylochernes scorpioides]|uniref:Uncharacterized protein n=1 Tax=Cordylochernes scorpioides TaxID=51811 RepID=A0ABY6KHY4_9ARAC|nr:hypothetical protein LAZ67_5004363 [Cordylochernes scorpioides]
MVDNRKEKASAFLINLKHDSWGMLRFFSDEKKFDVDQKTHFLDSFCFSNIPPSSLGFRLRRQEVDSRHGILVRKIRRDKFEESPQPPFGGDKRIRRMSWSIWTRKAKTRKRLIVWTRLFSETLTLAYARWNLWPLDIHTLSKSMESRQKQRAVIEFLEIEGYSASEIHQRQKNVNKEAKFDRFLLNPSYYVMTRPHISFQTSEALDKWAGHWFHNPHITHILAPCDFYLFSIMKKRLKEQRFEEIQEVKRAIKTSLRKQPPAYFQSGFTAWVQR